MALTSVQDCSNSIVLQESHGWQMRCRPAGTCRKDFAIEWYLAVWAGIFGGVRSSDYRSLCMARFLHSEFTAWKDH